MYVQKYKETKQLSEQQINEESYQTDSSADNDEDEEEEGEENGGQESDISGKRGSVTGAGGHDIKKQSTLGKLKGFFQGKKN